MDKAPDAFRTISEVAEELDLPQHVLRFWETRFSQIKPLKRGGGRRYYRPDDVVLLRGIRYLLYGEGYTIKGVQRILKESGARAVQEIWQAKQADADALDDEPLMPVPVTLELPPGHDVDLDAAEAAFTVESEAVHEPIPLAPELAHAPELAAAPAPAVSSDRYVPNANVSIVRGGLQRSGNEALPAPRRATPSVAAEGQAAIGLSSDDVQTLKAVLYELLETRKGLDLALNQR